MPVEEVLPESVQDEMLALTGDIAHNVVRLAVPLTSYLMGVAVGQGTSPEEALRIVAGLLPPGTRSDPRSQKSAVFAIVFPGHQV